MGHRASYAILEGAEVELFYSHWGALSVPLDVFWGPEAAEEFVRGNDPTDGWLDDDWGEGGVALDKDTKTVAFYGGELHGDVVRETFLALMRALWPGWTVHWVDGMPQIAQTVGVDPAVVTPEPTPPPTIEIDSFGENYCSDGFVAALVCLAKDGAVEDRCFDFGIVYGLMNGPAFVDAIAQMPTLDEVRKRPPSGGEDSDDRALGNRLGASVFIDPARCRIVLATGMRPGELEYLQGQWPGWTIEMIEGGRPALFEAMNRELPADLVRVPEADGAHEHPLTRKDAIEQIAVELFGSEDRKDDVLAFAARVANEIGEGGIMAPNLLDRIPAAPVDDRTRHQLFEDAIRGARWDE